MGIDYSLKFWGWFFLALYVGLMMILGAIAMKRVTSSDDFATARGSYGPVFLAFALTATTASGGTFIGIPALAYTTGFSALWYAFTYPLGVYVGVLLCLKAVRRAGAKFGNRSIPEFLGDRFQSESLRVCVSLFRYITLVSWRVQVGFESFFVVDFFIFSFSGLVARAGNWYSGF